MSSTCCHHLVSTNNTGGNGATKTTTGIHGSLIPQPVNKKSHVTKQLTPLNDAQSQLPSKSKAHPCCFYSQGKTLPACLTAYKEGENEAMGIYTTNKLSSTGGEANYHDDNDNYAEDGYYHTEDNNAAQNEDDIVQGLDKGNLEKAESLARVFGKFCCDILIAAGFSAKVSRGENRANMFCCWFRATQEKPSQKYRQIPEGDKGRDYP
ncbi:hypothetical protein SERLADRAFT_411247 [Serpula lacrymans var. lacrymans S7.9]|uniref:Uncharacterized protein n=1 Tax=Serpula lacrymans var. lacrymans (strain S7.9) TaxID=578457 RepID=F8P9R1_SERL9|nr:uncharacterized protein SERLADRAFT_411247 [Serpula lacrymans var. lacrymans S7.9]EGO20390.1 hypothetical protein SERLADRAFT_411247 [Serpula lacrymans var. lacrymans S7.9]